MDKPAEVGRALQQHLRPPCQKPRSSLFSFMLLELCVRKWNISLWCYRKCDFQSLCVHPGPVWPVLKIRCVYPACFTQTLTCLVGLSHRDHSVTQFKVMALKWKQVKSRKEELHPDMLSYHYLNTLQSRVWKLISNRELVRREAFGGSC